MGFWDFGDDEKAQSDYSPLSDPWPAKTDNQLYSDAVHRGQEGNLFTDVAEDISHCSISTRAAEIEHSGYLFGRHHRRSEEENDSCSSDTYSDSSSGSSYRDRTITVDTPDPSTPQAIGVLLSYIGLSFLAGGLFRTAAERFVQLGSHAEAARMYEKVKEHRLAMNEYARAGEFDEAKRIAMRTGTIEDLILSLRLSRNYFKSRRSCGRTR